MTPLCIGVAGLGTVGAGLLRLLHDNADLVAARAGRPIRVAAISARDRTRQRGISTDGMRWHDDAVGLAHDPAVHVVVELIGGSEGPARHLVEAALAVGKPVVTANKALLAIHGADLAARSEAAGVALAFEAAIAGGIPVVKALREGLAGNRIDRVAGILNGTCNYILTEMSTGGRAFGDVLAEAQRLGYAEADPSFDVDGIDAAHKLAILAALAFNRPVDFASVHVEGIRHVSAVDVAFANQLGYRIKLLGIARRLGQGNAGLGEAGLGVGAHGITGGVETRVHPCMVPQTSPIARVDGVFNAVELVGDVVGRVMLEGRGAGAGPTASAVVADLVDIARGRTAPVWGISGAALPQQPTVPISAHVGCYYLRLMVLDRPGVIADVAAALRDAGVSLESMLQRGRAPNGAVGESVPVVLVTHETNEAAMRAALDTIGALDAVVEQPALIRIEPA